MFHVLCTAVCHAFIEPMKQVGVLPSSPIQCTEKYIYRPLLHSAADLDEGIKRKRLDALKRALSLYSSRLGLDFKQGPGQA